MITVKMSSSILYDRIWGQFRKFSMEGNIEEGNGVFDLEGVDQPSLDDVSKRVEFFYYKVFELNCDPGEVINIRSVLASIYKRKIQRIGD